MEKWKRSRLLRRCCYACCCIVVTLVIIVAVLAIVARVLLKPKDVSLHVNSITLQQFDASLNWPTFKPSLTLVLDMSLLVYNPNRASFKFSNSTVLMYYHGDESAQTFVPAGKIPARGAVNISTVLHVDAAKVIQNGNFSSDFTNGTLPVTTRSQIRGRVNVWNIYKHGMVSVSSCQILLSIVNRTVIEYICENKRIF